MFISFEGGEGAGKTTLIERVHSELMAQGYSVLQTRAPGGTDAGLAIREILLHSQEIPLNTRCELFLFLADRAQHVEEVIFPALKEGKIVLCDRFNDSTVAYQGGARGFDELWIEKLAFFATQQRKPDLTFYLDLDPKLAEERMQGRDKDRIEAEERVFHEKVRDAYLRIAKRDPERFHVLNAARPALEVLQEALTLLQERVLVHKGLKT